VYYIPVNYYCGVMFTVGSYCRVRSTVSEIVMGYYCGGNICEVLSTMGCYCGVSIAVDCYCGVTFAVG